MTAQFQVILQDNGGETICSRVVDLCGPIGSHRRQTFLKIPSNTPGRTNLHHIFKKHNGKNEYINAFMFTILKYNSMNVIDKVVRT